METWKDISGYDGYEASDMGNIRAKEKLAYNFKSNRLCKRVQRILKCLKPLRSGYLIHTLKVGNASKSILAHRLVALAHLPNPNNKPFVNHKNGIKTDNRVENLEWCTRSENGIHAVLTGLHTALRGEENGHSKLTENDVVGIRTKANSGWSNKQISSLYNIGKTTVRYIIQKKLWGHVA